MENEDITQRVQQESEKNEVSQKEKKSKGWKQFFLNVRDGSVSLTRLLLSQYNTVELKYFEFDTLSSSQNFNRLVTTKVKLRIILF